MKTIFNFSKALVLCAALGLSTFYSCSTDSTDAESTSKVIPTKASGLSDTDLAKAKSLYANMVKTAAWTPFAQARDNFATKLKKNTVFFLDKSGYMNWIPTHLNLTGFSSITEFEAAYDNMITTEKVLVAQNPQLYNYIGGADGEQFYGITQPGLPQTPPTNSTNSCAIGCALTMVGEIGTAINNYNLDMEANVRFNMPSLNGAAQARLVAYVLGAVNNYNNCMSNC